MKKVQMIFLLTFVFLFTLAGPVPWNSASAQTCPQWIAKVVSAQGNVEVKKAGQTEWKATQLREELCPGDMIRVMEKSRAAIVLVTGAIVRLDQYSTIVFNGVEKGASLVEILKGVANFFSRWPRSLNVSTPFVNGTVEGTEFLVKVGDEGTLITIFEGKVQAENKAGSLTLTSGQSAIAEAGKAPVRYIVMRPRDAVQWALYYPPVTYHCPGEFREGDPLSYACRASSLLYAGRVDEAKADIEKALSIDPNNSDAIALQSIIAVVQNEKETALSLAKKAVETAPRSAAALIALSYAQQANFDLKGAMSSLKEAVKVEPENAFAWARLAEIHLSFGELDKALRAANQAVELNPNVSRTQTVLGFAYLTEVKTKQAKAAFEKAIELDQADPLPHLGLGLAEIRDGCLAEGRREIEIAVSLDPDNALIRSYLGKAFYEEKQDKMANDQYAMAKEFDPKDPTPFFYGAIKKQTENKPVEALQEMQKAIELNDNRAVYRSKLLLDADLAARSASLARIYTDLGFQDLALVEGWKSVNTDPADFSGHRFLADSYSALPRHEIARVSELLQSQLLQPININPVQPHLAESNLQIIEGEGPSDLSFNEFNPLFNRNRYAFQLNAIAGSHNTFGDEAVVSAVKDKISLSAGQFHYKTDGWRENNDQKQDIYNLFAQVELSPRTSVQAEFRAKDFDRGDLTLFFGKDNFIPTFREEDQERTLRIGFHHTFTPGSDLIGSFMYNNIDISAHYAPLNDPITRGIKIKTDDEEGYSAELQHIFSSKYIKFVSGVGAVDKHHEDQIALELLIPGGPPFPIKVHSVSNLDASHTNLYVYSYINYPKNVTFTIGGSTDFFNGAETDTKQFNPKFGVTWDMFPGTTFRAAAFRMLRRTIIINQTLEPTQVAGFNQFFDDLDATEGWRYGVAIDQKFSKSIYGGVEYSQRDLEFPAFILPQDPEAPVELKHLDRKERLGRAYIYWTLHQWIALSAEYQYEKINIDKENLGEFQSLRTNRFPLAVNFHHPSGFMARLRTTYIDQEGKFKPQGAPVGVVVPGSDNFWLVDASIGYRLPKRFGIISIDAKNLFDKTFQFQDIDRANPTIQPKRAVFARLTLAF